MVLVAGFRYYNVLFVIFAKKCCIIHPVKEYLVLYNFCIFLQLYLSHSHTTYVKQQVISCSTTLVYHSHIEKCDLGVEKLNKLNSWRPFWKISCNLFSSPN